MKIITKYIDIWLEKGGSLSSNQLLLHLYKLQASRKVVPFDSKVDIRLKRKKNNRHLLLHTTFFKESTIKHHPKCHPEWSSGRALVPDDSWYDLARMFLTIFKGGGSRILQVWYKQGQRVSITTEPAR